MAEKDFCQIIRHSINTEKSNMLVESSIYTLKVLKNSNKYQIKEAVERIFNVKVEKVSTLVSKGKVKLFKGRKGKRSDYKKALIKLKDGQKLDLNLGA